jgi:cellulose synthase/poly-beta-1,6-N-acetylglucosamine synthase-like glycosyltransferase/transposase-like protein
MSTQEKISAVKKVIKDKKSVASVAKESGVSRKAIYSWVKTYKGTAKRNKKTCLLPKYVKGSAHPKEYAHRLEQKLVRLIKKDPTLSVSVIAKRLNAGHHAVYSLLKALNLNTEDSRLAYCKIYSHPGIFEPEIKLSAAKSIIGSEKKVSEISKELRVARKTIYKWLKDYKESGEVKNKYVRGFDHPRALGEEVEKEVLDRVIETPELSIHALAQSLNRSDHAVFNILVRRLLTHKYERLAYSRSQAGEVSEKAHVATNFERVKSVFQTFTPNLAPAPPPTFTSLLKTFAISSVSSSLIFIGIILWFSVILGGGSFGAGVGLFFAFIALAAGTFFFLYSLKYYITTAILLSFSNKENKDKLDMENPGMNSDLDAVHIKKYPFVSVQIPFYNEKNVVERSIKAATSFDYPTYEVILCDDSTDETSQKIRVYQESCLLKGEHLKETKGDGWTLTEVGVRSGVTLKHLHRTTRTGYKGGALALALKLCNPKTEFISIFDADFVPYADSLNYFVKYFKVANSMNENYNESNIAAVQGYQWHVLNKSENWVTKGVRTEYAGSYVVERSGEEIYKGLKQISGSVYMIRKDVLQTVGWGTSITEDFELTLKIYDAGFKVVYTPYVQAPAECVSTLRRMVRQRMRWAEGHSFNVKLMAVKLLTNPKLTLAEKSEFVYLIPYYLQAFFFLLGSLSWLLSESVFRVRLPFWSELWGWSLVLTNMFSLPLMNAVGMFLEESASKDYSGIASFVALSYIIVPFQAYAAVKGFIEKAEGPWFRTPKTGHVTDAYIKSKFLRFIKGFLPGRSGVQATISAEYLALPTANSQFNNFSIAGSHGMKWKGKSFVAMLLIVSNLVVSLAPGVPYFIKPADAHAESFDAINGKEAAPAAPVSDFPNGVLVLNTDKSSYMPGDNAYLQIGVLDSKGDTQCNADITLDIHSPNQSTGIFKTADKTIKKSNSCSPDNNVTTNPDYFVSYKVEVAGVYTYELINNQNGYKIDGSFEAKTYSVLNVERVSATRINPFKSDYAMSVTVTANKNVSGKVSEAIPAGFTIDEGQTNWSINLKKGQSKTFSYTYQSPKISPNLYTLGPLSFDDGKSNSPIESNGWQVASDNTCTAAASTNWNLPTTWASGCHGNGPISGDTVNIGAYTVTVTTATPAAATVNFTATGGILTVTGTLNLSGALTANDLAAGALTATATGSGTLNVASIAVGNGTAPTSSTYATTLTSYVSTVTDSGGLTVNSYKGSSTYYNNGVFNLNAGTLSATAITTSGANGTNTMIFSMTPAPGTATLNLSSATPWSIGGTGTTTTSLNGYTNTVNYTGASQAICGTTYTNLTFSGSGTDTIGAALVVNSTFTNGSGITIATGNFALTFGGNFTNNGVALGAGTSTVTITGAATQSIAGYTTSGLTTMSKSGGVATYMSAVSGGALTMNGSGGTLNLGTTLTHTFTGTLTMTAGTLNGGSSTLNLQSGYSGTVATFTASTGTVNYNGSGAQTILGVTYNILSINNTAGVTLGAAATTTTLTIGNVTASSSFLDGGFQLTSTGTLNLTSGTFTLGSAGTATTFPAFATNNITAGTTVVYNSGVAQTISITPSYKNLTLSGAGTKTQGSGTLNVAGNWSNSGTFANNSQTVNLNGGAGTTQTISGTNTFYTLTATGSSARTIVFPSSVTTTISHSLTLTGAAGQLLTLSPSVAATIWTITPPATQSVSYVSVTYSTATSCINGTNSSGSNDIYWDFNGHSCATPTVTLSSPSNGGSTASTKPTFGFAGTVADSGNLEYDLNLINSTPVAVDSSSSGTVASSTTLQWSHKINANNNTILVVGIALRNGIAVTNVTFGAQTFTFRKFSQVSTDARSEIWTLANPTVSTNNITVTTGSATSITAGAVAYTGVTGVGFIAGGGNPGTQTASKIIVMSGGNNVVLDAIATQTANTGLTPANATESARVIQVGASNALAMGDQQSNPAGNTMQWNMTSDYWDGTAIELVAAYTIGFDRISTTNAGFSDVTHGADTHPFPSGDTINYTIQSAEQLPTGTYTWKVRAIEPAGTNLYGSWSSGWTVTVSNTAPTVALNIPASSSTINTTTPTLNFTGTDSDADNVEYAMQIDSNNTFPSYSTTYDTSVVHVKYPF